MNNEHPEKTGIDVSSHRPKWLDFMPNIHKPYTMFYDETNNPRRLEITDTGLNYEALDCFVLGGIAIEPNSMLPDVNELRSELRIQPSAPEIKLRHVAQGDYKDCLRSKKLEVFLTWLLDAPVYIHYSNFSVLNWSIVDLVDSLIAHHRYRHLEEVHDELKNELHALVRNDPLGYFRLLRTFDYPNVAVSRIPEFVSAVRAYLFRDGFMFRNFSTMALCDLLQDAALNTNLDFLVGNEPNVLVDRFDKVFLNRIATFTNATHVFDDEPQVRARLNSRQIVYYEKPITYSFVNSKQNPAVQISDVICGLLGKHFSSMEKLSIEELEALKNILTPQQRRNLDFLALLVDKADTECNAFIFNQASNDSKAKNLWFLHGIEFPEDYRNSRAEHPKIFR